MNPRWIRLGLTIAVAAAIPVWLVSPNVAMGLALASATLATFLLVSDATTAERPSIGDEPADDARAGWDGFRREIDRSRRHERPLALVALPIPRELDPRAARAALRAAARSIDVVWIDRGVLYLAMPETDRASALAVLARLRRGPEQGLGSGDWRVVVFPEDAMTADALVARLVADDGALESPRVPSSSL